MRRADPGDESRGSLPNSFHIPPNRLQGALPDGPRHRVLFLTAFTPDGLPEKRQFLTK